MEWGKQADPIMHVGKYIGVPISKLPLSYCRWIVMQSFPPDVVEAAKKKVESSAHSNLAIHVSRHSVDMFSLRFLEYWLESDAKGCGKGLATFVAEYAERAWGEGKDMSKKRYHDDGIVRMLDDICFVFAVSPNVPDYKEVVTIYPNPRLRKK